MSKLRISVIDHCRVSTSLTILSRMSWVLVVFYVPSTARSFRDGTRIYCPLRRTWSSVNTPFTPGIEPGPSRGSPLHYRCATPAPHRGWENIHISLKANSRFLQLSTFSYSNCFMTVDPDTDLIRLFYGGGGVTKTHVVPSVFREQHCCSW